MRVFMYVYINMNVNITILALLGTYTVMTMLLRQTLWADWLVALYYAFTRLSLLITISSMLFSLSPCLVGVSFCYDSEHRCILIILQAHPRAVLLYSLACGIMAGVMTVLCAPPHFAWCSSLKGLSSFNFLIVFYLRLVFWNGTIPQKTCTECRTGCER